MLRPASLADVTENKLKRLDICERVFVNFPKYNFITRVEQDLAEGAGFEPAVRFPARTLSKRVHSTTLAPFLIYFSFPYETRGL